MFMKLAVCLALFAVALAAPTAEDFSELKKRLDGEILHVETQLNKLFAEVNHAIHNNDHEAVRKVAHETMQMELHLHRLHTEIQKEMTTRKGDVSHYYLERKLQEVNVMFTQAADILFKIGEHERHHQHSTHAPTTHHHHHTTGHLAPGADFQKFRDEVDADIKHVELQLDRLFHDADKAVKDHNDEAKRHVIQETAGMEIHLHMVDQKLQAELKMRHSEVARYYLERKLEEVHVLFRQAADIFFKVGHIGHTTHHHHHHHSTHAPQY